MEVTRTSSTFEQYNYHFQQDDKIFNIIFGGNLDLYWNIVSLQKEEKNYRKASTQKFIITKENYFIYSLFEELFNDIKEAKLFEYQEPNNDYTKEELDEYSILQEPILTKESVDNYNERQKNSHIYKMLCKDNTITWVSDDNEYSVADSVTITKEKDYFILEFKRPELTEVNFFYHLSDSISIRFRTSGSRYNDFYIPFMRMYNKMQNYDPNYHQIHIEEIINKKKKILHK